MKILEKPFFYPILFFLSCILQTYSHNRSDLNVQVLIAPVLITLLFVPLIFAGIFVLLRNVEKSAAATFVFGIFFIYFTHWSSGLILKPGFPFPLREAVTN